MADSDGWRGPALTADSDGLRGPCLSAGDEVLDCDGLEVQVDPQRHHYHLPTDPSLVSALLTPESKLVCVLCVLPGSDQSEVRQMRF